MTSSRYVVAPLFGLVAIAILAFGAHPASRASRPPALVAIPLLLALNHIYTGFEEASKPEPLAVVAATFMSNLARSDGGAPVAVGERWMPNGVVQHWMQPYADLSRFANIAPIPLHVVAWADATHYVADDGRVPAPGRGNQADLALS